MILLKLLIESKIYIHFLRGGPRVAVSSRLSCEAPRWLIVLKVNKADEMKVCIIKEEKGK